MGCPSDCLCPVGGGVPWAGERGVFSGPQARPGEGTGGDGAGDAGGSVGRAENLLPQPGAEQSGH